MPLYLTNEVSLQLPDELIDKTINIFSLSDDSPSEFSLVIARDQLQAGERLGNLADKQLRQLSSRLQDFKLLRRDDVMIDHHPALSADYQWHSQNGLLHQRQITLLTNEQTKNGRVVITITATFKSTPLPYWEEKFTAILKGLQLRKA
ncbi:DcrB-related protein [Cystobacter ferrugineus]|uniref:DUF1795 domain-containing protein n=1 Tax=Cystobacter ferrugineus TaxID=83449 RepID=A0A1L9B7C0_9BACT|nr:DcrB-related protein [Cystobacter ferrugineus]OJH38154.1 hypothetical protein BON30_23670 [Cystobacter ferrugineus]